VLIGFLIFKKNCGRVPHSKFYKTKQRITERGILRERERERERGWRIYDKQRTTLSCGL